MTEKDIVTLPDAQLKQRSKRVNIIDDSIRALAQDMIAATLDWEQNRHHENAAALAAVQIGRPYRVIVVRRNLEAGKGEDFDVYINPEIIEREGQPEEDLEGCLSVSGIYGSVPRYPKVKIKALNLEGRPVKLNASGFLARVFQHEIDHLDGKVFLERVKDNSKLFELSPSGKFKPAKTDIES